MQTITAVIPAKIGEKNIERCVNSLKWCNETIVIWDKTSGNNFKEVQKKINQAIDNCKTDWILRVDADEVCTLELKIEICDLLSVNSDLEKKNQIPNHKSQITNCVAYGIPRKQYFIDGFLKGGDWAYDRLVRLFRPKFCRYDPIVSIHEQFKVAGIIGYLKNPLLHYSHMSIKDLKEKFESYTDLQINDLHDSKIKTIFNLITQPPYIFLRWMIWHKGYTDGLRGIKAAYYRSWYEFILYKKYLLRLFPPT